MVKKIIGFVAMLLSLGILVAVVLNRGNYRSLVGASEGVESHEKSESHERVDTLGGGLVESVDSESTTEEQSQEPTLVG